MPGREPAALTSDTNHRISPPSWGQSHQQVRLWSLGRALAQCLGFWRGSLPLERWEKQNQSSSTKFEVRRTVRSKGPVKVRNVGQPLLAPSALYGARCQKWVNITLYLIKNRRKQSSSYLLPGAKVSGMIFGSREFKSHSLMTQPTKYSRLAWTVTACFKNMLSNTFIFG